MDGASQADFHLAALAAALLDIAGEPGFDFPDFLLEASIDFPDLLLQAGFDFPDLLLQAQFDFLDFLLKAQFGLPHLSLGGDLF